MTKPKKTAEKKPSSSFANLPWEVRKGLVVKATPETGRQVIAGIFTDPAIAASKVIHSATEVHERDALDINDLAESIDQHAKAVSGGDTSRVEALLFAQAEALQSLFVRLSTRGMGCSEVEPFTANMKMALRAQSQCRATLETLAAIKNPPVVFAKQANIAHGHQQVNNGTTTTAPFDVSREPLFAAVPIRARRKEKVPNKLLGQKHEELGLDNRTPIETGERHTSVETVATLNGAAHARREVACEP